MYSSNYTPADFSQLDSNNPNFIFLIQGALSRILFTQEKVGGFHLKRIGRAALFLMFIVVLNGYAQVHEINGSPFETDGAPLPQRLKNSGEKAILVDPKEHVWGAYNIAGKLIRWGIATTGARLCTGEKGSCRTSTGTFRIYSLGNNACVSLKYDNASMPYCMYFNGGQALHGSSDVRFENVSHGCVRVHIDDAKWLRYHFVEGPATRNGYRGTKIVILSY